jgi:hypothetical protein
LRDGFDCGWQLIIATMPRGYFGLTWSSTIVPVGFGQLKLNR